MTREEYEQIADEVRRVGLKITYGTDALICNSAADAIDSLLQTTIELQRRTEILSQCD
jgi:hypothetical protein